MPFKVVLLISMVLLGCQTTRRQVYSPVVPVAPEIQSAPSESLQEKRPVEVKRPKTLGVILGPGGLRTYAHIGFLEELSKAKLQVSSIGGIEMGALVAALYSQKSQIYDVEWQMFKLNEKDWLHKGFIKQEMETGSIEEWFQYLDSFFSESNLQNAMIPFACPAHNLSRSQSLLMTKGVWKSLLPYCLTSYPYFFPYKSNLAAVDEVQSLAQFLRSKGAQQIIYVDVLGGDRRGFFFSPAESSANVLWTYVSKITNEQKKYVDEFLYIPIQEPMDDFSQRRQFLQKGREAGRKFSERFLSEQGY